MKCWCVCTEMISKILFADHPVTLTKNCTSVALLNTVAESTKDMILASRVQYCSYTLSMQSVELLGTS